jgi:hypothetical protein
LLDHPKGRLLERGKTFPVQGGEPNKGESQKGEAMKTKMPRPGYREVFCRFIIKNGKVIYPKKAKVFHFYVKA